MLAHRTITPRVRATKATSDIVPTRRWIWFTFSFTVSDLPCTPSATKQHRGVAAQVGRSPPEAASTAANPDLGMRQNLQRRHRDVHLFLSGNISPLSGRSPSHEPSKSWKLGIKLESMTLKPQPIMRSDFTKPF